jgi:hypothetical protein
MRLLVSSVLVSCLAIGALAQGQAPKPDANAVLAAAREALGGEKKLSAVKTFVATGRTKQVRGINLVPIEFEMFCELPDKFVRTDEIPAQESGPTTSGFVGDALVQLPAPPEAPAQAGGPATPGLPGAAAPAPGATARQGMRPAAPATSAAPPPSTTTPPRPGAPAAPPAATAPPGSPVPPTSSGTAAAPGAPVVSAVPGGSPAPGGPGAPPGARPDPRVARLMAAKQDFAKLTLGMFAASFSSYPLTFTFVGIAEAPQGKADIIDVKGPGNFAFRFFINDETHLPIMVSWTTPATSVILDIPGVPKPETIPPGSIIVPAPAPPAGTASKEEQDAYGKTLQDLRKKALAGAKPVENRLYYADYRDIGNGIRFPFRLRKAVGGETIEEINFDGFKTNSKIDPRKFSAAK